MRFQNMHVLYLAGWYPNDKNFYSGIFIKEQILAASPFVRSTVLSFEACKVNHGPLFKTEVLSSMEGQIELVKVCISLRIRRFGILDYFIKRVLNSVLVKIVKKAKIDLIHIQVLERFSIHATLLDVLKGIPVVYTEHWSKFVLRNQELIENKEFNISLKRFFDNSSLKKIMPVSKPLCNALMKLGAPAQKLELIDNVASDVFFNTQKNNPSSTVIVLAANWESPKDPDLFLQSLKRIQSKFQEQINVIWIGGGSQIMGIKQTASQFLLKNISFTGWLPKEKIAEILASGSFLVHPSKFENSPCIVSEALATGTPVLATNVGGIPDLITQDDGLVSNSTVQDFAKALEVMIKTWRNFDTDQIRRRAYDRFSNEVVGKKIFSYYNEVLSSDA